MAQRKLDRRGPKGHAMACADGLQPGNPLHNFGRGIDIVELGIPPRKDAGIEHAPCNNRNAACGRLVQKVGPIAVEERIASGKETAIKVGLLHRGLDHRAFVHAKTIALDGPACAQLFQRAKAAAGQVTPVAFVAVAVRDPADVVQKDEVDPGAAHPLLAVVKTAHDTVMGIIEHLGKTQPVHPAGIERIFWCCICRTTGPGCHHQTARLGADNGFAGGFSPLAQKVAKDVLRPTKAIHWCGIEIADAPVPGRL